jgi:hypothetical protein
MLLALLPDPWVPVSHISLVPVSSEYATTHDLHRSEQNLTETT